MFSLSCLTTPYRIVSHLISYSIEPHHFLLTAVFLLAGLVLGAPVARARTAMVGGHQIAMANSGLVEPEGVAVDGAGDVYISGSFNNRVGS